MWGPELVIEKTSGKYADKDIKVHTEVLLFSRVSIQYYQNYVLMES